MKQGTHYLLTGQKMWISNAGFAHVLIVFAKIGDDKNLTAFIVERDYEGITMNDEEKKLGIKGSSTRQVFFNDTPVPVENMLSARGNGFKIAVNILNIGRIKLGAACIGGAKDVATAAINYANERKQFGTQISNFGAIKHKIAEFAVKSFASESAAYRASNDIEEKINSLIAEGMDSEQAKLKGLEEFAIECAILKVHGSEVLDYTVDEGLQIYGGMGFSAEAPMERAYRDSRITRIYEGTNEINRMLIVGMIFKRAMKGQLDLMTPGMAIAKELMSPSAQNGVDNGLFAEEKRIIANLKKAIILVAGKAGQDLGASLNDEQEILMNLADMVIELYAAESTLLRVEKLVSINGEEAVKQQINLMRVYLYQATDKINIAGKEAVVSYAKPAEMKGLLKGLSKFTRGQLINPKALRREIADYMIEKNEYAF